jgi:glycosyltransferase involved in cell wall biosynthesis
MRHHPSFSVVVPTYNRASVLMRSINSVLRQSRTDIELVVVDDGSTDETRQLLQRIEDPRLRITSTTRFGPSGARNAGAEIATGRYLTFLDSDDEASPHWLATFSRQFQQDDSCGIACCGVLHAIAPDGRQEIKIPHSRGPEYDYCRALFIPGSYCVRREAFLSVGGFVPHLPYGEHHELALRIVPYCTSHGLAISSSEDVAVKRNIDVPRERLRRYREARYRGATYVLKMHRSRLARNPRLLSNYLANAGVSAGALGNLPEARRLLRQAITTYPRNLKNYARLMACFSKKLAERRW